MGQSWSRCFDDADLPGRVLLDLPALMIRQRAEATLDFLSIEERDGKQADTATATALSAGDSTEKGGLGPCKPAVCFFEKG